MDHESLSSLSREDYRSPDPAHFFPLVANGALNPESLDKPSFRALEDLVSRLTMAESSLPRSWDNELLAVWERLQEEYPSACAHKSKRQKRVSAR